MFHPLKIAGDDADTLIKAASKVRSLLALFLIAYV